MRRFGCFFFFFSSRRRHTRCGRDWSSDVCSSDLPTAEALAIKGNRIVAVGSTKEIREMAGPNTRVIDAGKKDVLPGFNDAHVHFLGGGFQLSSVDLRDADTPHDFAERIRRFAEKVSAGRWITGGDWDHERWTNAPLPTRELIDRFTPETP